MSTFTSDFNNGMEEVFRIAATLPEDERNRLIEGLKKMGSSFNEAISGMSQLEKLARTDILTGFPNRLGMQETLHGGLEELKGHPERTMVVAALDLDGFSDLNDNCGRHAGDLVLKEATKRLYNEFGGKTFLARPGNDEIIMILGYGEGQSFDQDAVAAKMRNALKGMASWKGSTPYPVTTSIGFARISGEELTAKSDVAMLGRHLMQVVERHLIADKQGMAARLSGARDALLAGKGLAPTAPPIDRTALKL